ncbi:MAG: tetratricopeptide repeat protein, partial [Saprospiraceae bacterium]
MGKTIRLNSCKFILLSLIIASCSPFCIAQKDLKLDSLLNALHIVKDDTSKVNTLNAISYHLLSITAKYTDAKRYADSALNLAIKVFFKKGIAKAYLIIGLVYKKQSNYSEALKNFLASLKIREEIGDKNGIASSYTYIGNIYFAQGNYPEALKNYLASLKIQEEIGDKKQIALVNDNIGNIYYVQGNYPEALNNYLVALKIS